MLGAEVHPVPAVAYENPKNYNHQARDFAAELPNAIWTDQFDNTANAQAHYLSTGPEIWEQTGGNLDGFICSTGTGGTLAGVGKYLKEKSGGRTQVWLADPPGSVLYSYIRSGGKLNERAGSSITEGSIEPAPATVEAYITRLQESAKVASRTTSGRSSMIWPELCTFRTRRQ